MLTAKQLGKQLIIVLSIGLLFIALFNIVNNYYSTKNTLEKEILEKLYAITKTMSIQLDGDLHEDLVMKYKYPKDSNEVVLNQNFKEINSVLTKVQEINGLKTNIYTLFKAKSLVSQQDLNNESLRFGVISGSTQYFRNKYELHPIELLKNFNVGGILPEYSSENGTWLSAFSPVYNGQGKTVAVVQADIRINDFLDQVWDEAVFNALISLLIILVTAFLMMFFVVKMVRNDREKTELIKLTSKALEAQNLKIKDSINYAQRIQRSIIPDESQLMNFFSKSFIFSKAKDVVSGDFPWIYGSGNSVYIAAIDCTGHGVPGAMVSFVGYFLLEKINHDKIDYTSLEIVEKLHVGVNKTLKQENDKVHNNDGMDAAFCKIDIVTNELCFSGANRPLYLVRNNELIEYKGVRRGIGGTQYENTDRAFLGCSIPLLKGDRLFVFSDGYVDQFGGPNGKKLGKKTLKKVLISGIEMSKLKDVLNKQFVEWKGDLEQTDDVLFIGFEI